MLLRIILPVAAILFFIILIWFGYFGLSVKPKMVEKEIPASQLPQ